MEHRKVVIIGSGPAGYTAAIYTARAQLQPLMFEGGGGYVEPLTVPGGQLMITTEVENYPGFPHGIKGPEMMDLFKQQAVRFGTEVRTADVTKVDFSTRPFRITAGDAELLADTCIIATGASARWLDIPSEKKFQAVGGVSACATCDGAFFKDVPVAIVGGGDTAMEEAQFLTRFSPRVTLIHRRREFRASRIMLERVRKNPRIEILTPYVVEEVLGEVPRPGVTGLRLRNPEDGSTRELAVQGLFVAIGHVPNSAIFADWLDRDGNGYLLTQPGTTRTKVPGVFACGDVADHVYRQAITAAGTGCMAAIDAERFLAEHG